MPHVHCLVLFQQQLIHVVDVCCDFNYFCRILSQQLLITILFRKKALPCKVVHMFPGLLRHLMACGILAHGDRDTFRSLYEACTNQSFAAHTAHYLHMTLTNRMEQQLMRYTKSYVGNSIMRCVQVRDRKKRFPDVSGLYPVNNLTKPHEHSSGPYSGAIESKTDVRVQRFPRNKNMHNSKENST